MKVKRRNWMKKWWILVKRFGPYTWINKKIIGGNCLPVNYSDLGYKVIGLCWRITSLINRVDVPNGYRDERFVVSLNPNSSQHCSFWSALHLRIDSLRVRQTGRTFYALFLTLLMLIKHFIFNYVFIHYIFCLTFFLLFIYS